MTKNNSSGDAGYFRDVSRKFDNARALWGSYWKSYGGFAELFRSIYFIVPLALTALTFGTWTTASWFVDPIGALPNLLGFSLGALTLFLCFGSDQFREFMGSLRGSSGDSNSYVDITTTFVHFIVVQCIALMVAFVLKAAYAIPFPAWAADIPYASDVNAAVRQLSWLLGYWLFLYALALSLAAVMAMFLVVRMYDIHRASVALDQDDDEPDT